MEEIKLPDAVGHIHSNGDFCAERQVESRDWPVNLYTADQIREAILAERERCAMLVEKTPAEAFCTVMHQAQLQRARETFAAAIRKG